MGKAVTALGRRVITLFAGELPSGDRAEVRFGVKPDGSIELSRFQAGPLLEVSSGEQQRETVIRVEDQYRVQVMLVLARAALGEQLDAPGRFRRWLREADIPFDDE